MIILQLLPRLNLNPWYTHTLVVLKIFCLTDSTLGHLYQYLVAQRDAKIGLKVNKSDNWRHPWHYLKVPWVQFHQLVYTQLLHAQIQRAQKSCLTCLSFLRFWDLRALKLLVKCWWNWPLVEMRTTVLQKYVLPDFVEPSLSSSSPPSALEAGSLKKR